ncbi:MAG: endolytic transglycosylase MltG, partial [Boseongicola sp.]|nr:endolytic transglycosylase MltG [Boseongicola sp.]
MWRNLASNVLTLMIVALVVAFGGLTWAQRQYQGPGPLADAICLQVQPGSNMRRVAADLEAQGAVTNGTIYRLGADYSGRANDLKAGSFLVEEGASMAEIVDAITGEGLSTCGTEVIYRVSVNSKSVRVRELDAASQEFEVTAEFDPGEGALPAPYVAARDDVATRYRVVIAEGVTSWQVVDALRALDVFEGEVAEVPPEGTLAPDGYEVRPGQDRMEFLNSMA